MEKSTSIVNLAKALLLFQTKMDKIKKDGNNPFFKSKYATLSNILEAIQLPLAESGLTFSQFPSGDNGLTTILMHGESGEFMESTCIMHPVKNDPQSLGSAITYNRRYSLQSVLGLNIEEDDDGHRATHNGSEKAEKNGSSNGTGKNGEVKIDEWLTEEQFNKAMKSDAKGINATLIAYGMPPKGMKAEYRAKLNEQLKKLYQTLKA